MSKKQSKKLFNKSQKTVICEHLIEAQTFFKKLKGLMFAKSLNPSYGLWIQHCKSVHTCFMKFSIDLIFINKKKRIVGLVEDMKPWKLSPLYWKAESVIEVPAHTIKQHKLKIGEQLDVVYQI